MWFQGYLSDFSEYFFFFFRSEFTIHFFFSDHNHICDAVLNISRWCLKALSDLAERDAESSVSFMMYNIS